MVDKKNYLVALKDVTENERLILKLIFAVSEKTKSRKHAYTLKTSDDPLTENILILGTPKDKRIIEKRDRNGIFNIYLVNNTPGEKLDNCLQRPLTATRVLTLLDHVVTHCSNHVDDEQPMVDTPESETVENSQDSDEFKLESAEPELATPLQGDDSAESIDADSTQNETDDISDGTDEQTSIDETETHESDMVCYLDDHQDTDNELLHEEVAEELTDELAQDKTEDHNAEEHNEELIEEIEFTISEAEASELAIVEDESQSNPANLEHLETLYELDDSNLDDQIESIKDIASPTLISSLTNSLLIEEPAETNNEIVELNTNIEDKPKALVVDDSASVRKQIELELNLFYVDVDYAETAEQAYEMLKHTTYKVAFLDVVLPDSNGFEICKSIKKGDDETIVIMLTAKATHSDKLKGTLAGCDSYLVKPVGRVMFQNTVKSHLQPINNSIAVEA